MINLSKLIKTDKSSQICALPGFCIDYDNILNTTRIEDFVLNNTIFNNSDFEKMYNRVQVKKNNSKKNNKKKAKIIKNKTKIKLK